MTEPQDPQSTPQNYPSYPGQQPESAAAPGGPAPYPTGAYPQQPGVQAEPGKRPGSVTAAGWITILLSFLSALTAAALFAATSRAVDYVYDHPDQLEINPADLPAARGDFEAAIFGIAGVLLVIALIGILLGFAVLKRQGWARILLIATSALTALVGLIASFGIVGIPWLVGSIAVIVLLLGSRAGAWFKAGRA